MFTSQKRVFAGKQNLHAEPFCPIMSNESGFLNLRKAFSFANQGSSGACQPRPSIRGGKSRT